MEDEILKNAAKSDARLALKVKFKQWDKELEETNVVTKPVFKYQLSSKNFDLEAISFDKKKSIGRTWWVTVGKLAMAACILIGVSFTIKLILDSDYETANKFSVSNTKPFVNDQINKLESNLEIISAEEKTINLKYLNDIEGFAETDEKQKIVIENNFLKLKYLNSRLQSSVTERINDISKITNEIKLLNNSKNTYLFKDNVLRIKTLNNFKEIKLIKLSNMYTYIKLDNNYYSIRKNKSFKQLVIEKDSISTKIAANKNTKYK